MDVEFEDLKFFYDLDNKEFTISYKISHLHWRQRNLIENKLRKIILDTLNENNEILKKSEMIIDNIVHIYSFNNIEDDDIKKLENALILEKILN